MLSEIGCPEHTSSSGEISSQKGILLLSYHDDHHLGYTIYFGACKIISILRTKTRENNYLWDLKIQFSFHLATAISLLSQQTNFWKKQPSSISNYTDIPK